MGEPRYVEVPLSTGKRVQVRVKTLHPDDDAVSQKIRTVSQIDRFCAIQECALQGIPFDPPSGLVVLQERFDALKARFYQKHKLAQPSATDDALGGMIQADADYALQLEVLDADYRQAVRDNQSKPPELSKLSADDVEKAISTIEVLRNKGQQHRREVIGLLIGGKHGKEEVEEVANTCTANDYFLMQTGATRPDLLPKLLPV